MTKELLYSPLWTVGKKLYCLLEVQCQQRELSFISVPRNLRILAFGKVYIWVKNCKQPFWSVSFSGMLWLFFVQMLQNLKLKLLETRHDYITESSGNPEPVATACSGLGKKQWFILSVVQRTVGTRLLFHFICFLTNETRWQILKHHAILLDT